MSKIVYKQRFYSPNKAKTADNNYYYIRYIATRDGVEYNDYMNHGLFGSIDNQNLRDFDTWQEAAKKIRDLSDKNYNIYRGIISLKRDTAMKLDLDRAKSWKRYIEENVHILAKENNIEIKNLNYVLAYHDNKNPHIHIAFWDSKQSIMKNYLSPNIGDSIRRKLIQTTFRDDLRELYKEKDFNKAFLRKTTFKFLDDNSSLYTKDKDLFTRKLRSIAMKIKDENLHAIINIYEDIFKSLPKKGSIDYKYLDNNLKQKIDGLVKLIIENPLIKESYSKSLETYKNIDNYYVNDEEKLADLAKKHEKELKKWIANTILKEYRKYLKYEKAAQNIGEEWKKEARSSRDLRLFKDVLARTFLYFTSLNEISSDYSRKEAKLSKLAIKDYIKKTMDKAKE